MPTLKRLSSDTNKGTVATKSKTQFDRQDVNDEDSVGNNHFSQSTESNPNVQIRAQHESSLSIAIASASDNHHRAIDVVGVVLSTAIYHPPHTSSKFKLNNTRVRILIADHSLPDGQCARVNMTYDVRDNSNVLDNLQPGDVVRFNRMEVRNFMDVNECESTPTRQSLQTTANDDSTNCELTSNSHDSLLKVVCDLYPSWKTPAFEQTYTRLCRINPFKSNNERSSEELNIDWEHDISSCMVTSRCLILELANWYCSKHHSFNASIASQQCQRRKLRDITTPNISSHIVVKVLRCEKVSHEGIHNTQVNKTSCVTHATLIDGPESDDIMGLGGSIHIKQVSGDSCFIPKSIADVLLQSLVDGACILLTHVISKRVSKDASHEGLESLILLPTRDTIATSITADHPFYVQNLSRSDENIFASQPITLERATNLFSMSQQHSPSSMIGSCSEDTYRGVMVVVSPLLDIIVDGIFASFLEGRFWQTNQSLSKFLIDTPTISTPFKSIELRPTYRSGKILLDPSVFSKEMIIKADGDALKLLCMEVPAEDMVVDAHDDAKHPYLSHVGSLLRGLCEEKTKIRWVLEQESECNWIVSSASLIEI